MTRAVAIRADMRRFATAQESGEAKRIPTHLLRVGAFRTRSDANFARGVDELAESIARLGVIEPIIVRRRGDGTFDVIAGERRLTASKRLGLASVPCIVRQCSDGDALSMALVENLQRCDLNPVERACCIRRLIEEFGVTQAEIGTLMGMSQSSVAHHLKLLSLPGAIRQFIETGELTMGHGKVLGRLPNVERAMALAMWCVHAKKSVRQLEAEVERELRPDLRLADSGRPKQRREGRELPNGVYVVIKEKLDGSESGILEIPYYSAQERDWVIRALSLK